MSNLWKFSANLGFLWNELPLVDAIHKAAVYGFDAVECHWPYGTSEYQVFEALQETGLPMLSINTRCGELGKGEFGLSTDPDRGTEARDYIDEAIAYGAKIGVSAVHVMAGQSDGGILAQNCYRDNLTYAASAAAVHGISILIEPINRIDVENYHLSYVEDAVNLIKSLGFVNLKLMFDCYHIQVMQGDICRKLIANTDHIGHVQIAAVPDRGEPNSGELFYPAILKALYCSGYKGFVGAEYRPRQDVESGLGWLSEFKKLSEFGAP